MNLPKTDPGLPTRRVGEATVEVSAFFMGRVLGLTRYLNENHIAKQGLRFWFRNKEVESIDQASDLMSLAFRLDLSLYYWGVVMPPFTEGASTLTDPPKDRDLLPHPSHRGGTGNSRSAPLGRGFAFSRRLRATTGGAERDRSSCSRFGVGCDVTRVAAKFR